MRGEGIMAKGKGAKKETKSDFIRDVLAKKPELDHHQVNHLWTKAGHPGAISASLFCRVRARMGIKIEWGWAKANEPRPAVTSLRSRRATPRSSRQPPGAAAGTLYQFRITLLNTQPPIWRRIQVMDCTLDKLHEYIQTAMGWTNSHLSHFKIGGRCYGEPMLMEETFAELKYLDSTTTMLHEVLPEDGKRFRFEYEYDFGDSWMHEVLFEGCPKTETGKRYPLCLEGAGACPPEDVGGVWGYLEFLAAIADPENDQHDEMLEWIGGKFDPNAFNPVAATNRMKRGLPH
jgi:hypothetical protein